MDFTDKVVLITGGGNGIGRATAAGLAERGATVVVVDRDADGARATIQTLEQKGGKGHAIAADVTQASEVKDYVAETLDKYGRIDCFFNNAGIEGKVAPIAECDEENFDAVMSVNVKGVFLGLRHVLPVMLEQGFGSVVNTASIAGLLGTPGMPAYVASKHAVMGLTKVAAGEVSPKGIESMQCVRDLSTPAWCRTSRNRSVPTTPVRSNGVTPLRSRGAATARPKRSQTWSCSCCPISRAT